MCADIGDDVFNESAARRFVRRNGNLPARIRRRLRRRMQSLRRKAHADALFRRMDCRKRSHQRRRRAERANVRQVPRKTAGDFAKDRRPRTAKRKNPLKIGHRGDCRRKRGGRGTRRIYRGDADKKKTQKIRRAKVCFYFNKMLKIAA